MNKILIASIMIVSTIASCKKATDFITKRDRIDPVVENINNSRVEMSKSYGNRPSVVFISGFATDLSSWSSVYERLNCQVTKFAYNRPGTGRSADQSGPRDARTIAGELKNILDASNIKPPYILVAHSMGGIYARLFYHQNPGLVKGIVLVDATHENQLDSLLSMLSQQEREAVYDGLMAANDSLLNLMPAGSLKEEFRANLTTNYNQIRQYPAITNLPLYVITSTKVTAEKPAFVNNIQRALHQQWAINAGPLGRFVATPNSGHYIQIDEPHLVVEGINWIIAR